MKHNLIIESWRGFLNEQGGKTWVVQKGHNITMIAKAAGVPVAAVIGANPQIKDVNKIYPGQRIVVPAGEWSEMSKTVLTRGKNKKLWKEVDKLCADLKKKITYPIKYKTSRSFGDSDMGGLTYGAASSNYTKKSLDQLTGPENMMWPVELVSHDMDLYSRSFDKKLGQVFDMLKRAISWLNLKNAEIAGFDGAPTKRGDVQSSSMVPKGTFEAISDLTVFMTAVFVSITVRHEMMHMIHRELDYAKSMAAGKGVGYFGTKKERAKRRAQSEKLCRIADFRWIRGPGKRHLGQAQMFLEFLLRDIVEATFSSKNSADERREAEISGMVVRTNIMNTFQSLLNQERDDSTDHIPQDELDQLWNEPT